MRKSIGKYLLVAIVASLAACNDGSLAPKSHPSSVAVQGSLAALTHDTTYFSFTIDNSVSSSVYIGAGNSVRFPAGSVCDPSSSYGATEWDNACTPASSPVTVAAKAWLDGSDHPRVDFDTHIRFVPTSDPSQYVTIVFTDTSAALNSSSDILYCATTYTQCVSELAGDSSLVTVKDLNTHVVTRRIKHFSGYTVGDGGGDCPPDNPDCNLGGAGFNKIGRLQPGNSASATIGVRGGVLDLPSAGLKVIVPAGALARPTTLSVTQRAGSFLAYEFQPHGLQFARPLTVVQALGGTGLETVALRSLRAVYFANESQVDDASGSVTPSELMNVSVDAASRTASFQIHHFSGYMFATGNDCGSRCDSEAPQDGGAVMSLRTAGGRLSAVARVNTAKIVR